MASVDLNRFRFGIELEVDEMSRRDLAECVTDVVGGEYEADDYDDDHNVTDRRRREWQCKYDGSVGSHGAELASPPMTLEDLPDFLRIVERVRWAGAVVNSSCGLHIHVDAADFDARRIINLVNLVYAQESRLYAALRVEDSRADEYAQPLDDHLADVIRRSALRAVADAAHSPFSPNAVLRNIVGHANYSRYYGLNFCALRHHGTIEFRYFNATLDPAEITAYVHLVLALMAFAYDKRTVAVKTQKPLVDDCARFDMRCLLVRLGLNGDEYQRTRTELLKHLGGSGRRAVGRTCTEADARPSRGRVPAMVTA